jgi:RNA polymerase-binding transcription factor DksA
MKKILKAKRMDKINTISKIPNSKESNSYSEKELAQFRMIIIDKLDEARKNNEFLMHTLSRNDDHGTEDTSPTFKVMEDSSNVEAKEETAQLALRQGKFIQNLQNALIRIENKTYGICRVTGKLIPKGRLLSVPHATLSIDAKLGRQFNEDTL